MFDLRGKTVATWSLGLRRNPTLPTILELKGVRFWPRSLQGVDAVIGWGNKKNTERAIRAAREAEIPYLAIEDGFLRSFRPGVAGDPPLSLVVDDLGTYYDASRHSRLESLISDSVAGQSATTPHATTIRQRFVDGAYGKYNNGLSIAMPPDGERDRVLVVDQTAGDMSIQYGAADAASFERMLQAALDENPQAEILIKTHPDVMAGRRRGHYDKLLDDPRLRLLDRDYSAASLLPLVSRVYTVTSHLGFEALLRDVPVRCFGLPWYAGWGLTDDEQHCERRRATPTVDQLFNAAYLQHAHYLNPATHQPGGITDVMDWVDRQRAQGNARYQHTLCIGFRAWKKGHLRQFVGNPAGKLTIRRDAKGLTPKDLTSVDRVVLWGSREAALLERHCRDHQIPWLRMEDGFLRSVGLGSDFVRPASLVFDDLGMYYDPRRPSRLERLLAGHQFTDQELQRAGQLIDLITETGLSKYNLGSEQASEWPEVAGKRRILVAGQVEDDASVRLGCPGVRSNLALLERVRGENPGAFIVYKPHPDVLAGNRVGSIPARDMHRVADLVVEHLSIHACIAWVDEVHVMTSLTGFEALLAGKQVVTHGQPFYAGWGLTRDRIPVTRRNRQLSLPELVAATLLLYPCYYDWTLRGFTTPEAVVQQLVQQKKNITGQAGASRLKRMQNKALNLWEGLGGR